jgi:hypothetical protein
MPTVNNNFSTLITAIDTKAQSLAASTTDPKDLVFLGKTLEALNVTAVVSDVIGQGDTEVARVLAQGNTSVAAVAAAGSGYASLADPTFTGTMNAGNAILSGNLTVNGTTTTINTSTLDVEDKNITVAKGAADGAAANGGGLTIEGAGVTFNYVDANKHMALNTGLKVEEIKEAVTADTTTAGVINVDGLAGAVRNFTANQTANRTINFRGDGSTALNVAMAVGESMTFAIMMAQGSTAYYLNAYQIDGSAVTPKWQGGTAPTGGNASSVDSYSFTIIKTAASTYTVLASLAAFA